MTLIRSAGLGLALAGTIAVGWRNTHPDEPAPAPTCAADAASGEDAGATYHRDPAQGCAWVDANGHLVEVDANGRPIHR